MTKCCHDANEWLILNGNCGSEMKRPDISRSNFATYDRFKM